jgi:hypothetical protein
MFIGNRSQSPTLISAAILALAMVCAVVSAQDQAPAATETAEADTVGTEVSVTDTLPSPNPTLRTITPRHDQSPFEQQEDERECFEAACGETGWNPYEAYDELVVLGYAVELSQKDKEAGLVCLAYDGAVTGAVAGEMLGVPHRGAAVGAAVGVARGVILSDYLNREDDPEAQRAVADFERKLRDWDHRYSGCLRAKGYRVPSS